MLKTPTPYQSQCFFTAMGYYPNTESELGFACALPVSAEDASWLHTVCSAEYASRVVLALENNDIEGAMRHLIFFRKEGEQSRGMGKEALVILQASGIIPELYEGNFSVPNIEVLNEIQVTLERIQATPRPESR